VETIKRFVHQGGGYVGICGGAYFAGERIFWQGNQLQMNSLGLFSGETRGAYDEIVTYPDSTMCLVISSQTPHPITETHPDSSWILYFWGPALLPDDGADVTILGLYDTIDQPAMLATEYGRGRVFLIGTHPEIEEDSDRDSVAECDELDDQGTDWELMRSAADWCLGK
jgi:biotin--protein ligase